LFPVTKNSTLLVQTIKSGEFTENICCGRFGSIERANGGWSIRG
ncbi:1373_t:CDS:1, partial [Entrophospora sp. SA101]